MRNLKKLLAVLLAVAMMATMVMVPVFAEETEPTDAEIIADLGILVGEGNGVTAEYLAKDTRRIQAAVLIVKLMGKLDEATSGTYTENFTDANLAGWADGERILGYLYANPELGWAGNTDGSFDPQGLATPQMLYKVILELLGYETGTDFEYDDAVAFAASKGLVAIADVTTITNNDVAIAFVEALKASLKDESKTFAQDLVDKGVISKSIAQEYGLVEPDKLAVKSVTADNLKQVYVEFNKDVTDTDGVTDTDNYTLVDEDGDDLDLDDASVVDKYTVVLTLEEAAEQQSDAKLTVKSAILGTAEDFELEFDDQTLPKVLDAKIIGNDTVKVIFSEPINFEEDDDNIADPDYEDEFEIKIGTKSFVIDEINVVNNGTEANVSVFSTWKEGDLTLTVGNGLADYAGYRVTRRTFELEIVEDTEPPEITGYKSASVDKVTLIFNEDIQVVTKDAGDFYHTNSKNTVGTVKDNVTTNGNELTLEFDSDNQMPDGTVYVYVADGAISDLWDNENDTTLRYQVEITKDDTKPTVEKIEVASDSLSVKVTFSETLEKDSAEKAANYTILDSKDKDTNNIRRATLDKDKVTLDLRTKLDPGDYTLEIEKVKDRVGNTISAFSGKFTAGDEGAPEFPKEALLTVAPTRSAEYSLVLKFTEGMATDGKYSVLDLDKYELIQNYYVDEDNDGVPDDANDDGKPDVAPTSSHKVVPFDDDDFEISIKSVNDNRHVEITIKDFDGTTINVGTDAIRIGRVADDDGNYTKDHTGIATIVNAGEQKIAFSSAKATEKDTLEVEFTSDLDRVQDSDFAIIKSNSVKFTAEKGTLSSEDLNTVLNTALSTLRIVDLDVESPDEITISVNDTTEFDADAANYYLVAKSDSSVDRYGVKLQRGAYIKIEDGIAPSVKDEDGLIAYYSTGNNTGLIIIEFDEEVAADTITRTTFEVNRGDHKVEKVGVSDEVYTDPNDYTAGTLKTKGNVVLLWVKGSIALGERDIVDLNGVIEDLNDNTVTDLRLEVGSYKELTAAINIP